MFWREGSVAIQRQLGTSLQVQAKESHKVGRRCRKLRNCRSWATCKSSVSWIDEDFDDAPPDASKISLVSRKKVVRRTERNRIKATSLTAHLDPRSCRVIAAAMHARDDHSREIDALALQRVRIRQRP